MPSLCSVAYKLDQLTTYIHFTSHRMYFLYVSNFVFLMLQLSFCIKPSEFSSETQLQLKTQPFLMLLHTAAIVAYSYSHLNYSIHIFFYERHFTFYDLITLHQMIKTLITPTDQVLRSICFDMTIEINSFHNWKRKYMKKFCKHTENIASSRKCLILS